MTISVHENVLTPDVDAALALARESSDPNCVN